MVNPRAVSALLALSCIAAPLLRVSCEDDDDLRGILDASNDRNLDIDGVGDDGALGQKNNGDFLPEEDDDDVGAYGAHPLPDVVDVDDLDAAENNEDVVDVDSVEPLIVPSVAPKTGDSQEPHHHTPELFDVEEKGEPQEEVKEAPVAEPPSEEAKPEEGEEKKAEAQAPLGFFGRLKKSMSNGFSSIKSAFTKSKSSSETASEEPTSSTSKDE